MILITVTVVVMKKPVLALALASVSALALAGCAAGTPDDGQGGGDAFTVVASTNVYAQIAQEIAGDDVEIVPIIDSPTASTTARSRVAVSPK